MQIEHNQANKKWQCSTHKKNDRKLGYMEVVKRMWNAEGYENLALSSQNLGDHAAALEKHFWKGGKQNH